MSELNNNEKENIVDPHLKKKGGIGALIFFIILYMICAAFVTYYNIRTNDYYQMGLIDYFKKHGTVPQFDVLLLLDYITRIKCRQKCVKKRRIICLSQKRKTGKKLKIICFRGSVGRASHS